jgi:serine/threonine protein kinase
MSSRLSSNSSFLAAPSQTKLKAIKEAQNQQRVADNKIRRLNLKDIPKFRFIELIGKGTYGRVYKRYVTLKICDLKALTSWSEKLEDEQIVAVKVLETDRMDFTAPFEGREAGIEDALKEIRVLRRLREHNTKNVNIFLDALQVDDQLWIVNEYCSGGSITTLVSLTIVMLSSSDYGLLACCYTFAPSVYT